MAPFQLNSVYIEDIGVNKSLPALQVNFERFAGAERHFVHQRSESLSQEVVELPIAIIGY